MNNQHHNYYIEPDFSLRNIITLLLKRAEMCFHLFQLLGNTSLFMLCIKSASLHFPAVTENRAGRQGECGWFPESSRFHTLLQHPPPLLSRTCIFPSPGKAGNRDARTLVRMRTPPGRRWRRSAQAHRPQRALGGAGLAWRLSLRPRLERRHLGRECGRLVGGVSELVLPDLCSVKGSPRILEWEVYPFSSRSS